MPLGRIGNPGGQADDQSPVKQVGPDLRGQVGHLSQQRQQIQHAVMYGETVFQTLRSADQRFQFHGRLAFVALRQTDPQQRRRRIEHPSQRRGRRHAQLGDHPHQIPTQGLIGKAGIHAP